MWKTSVVSRMAHHPTTKPLNHSDIPKKLKLRTIICVGIYVWIYLYFDTYIYMYLCVIIHVALFPKTMALIFGHIQVNETPSHMSKCKKIARKTHQVNHLRPMIRKRCGIWSCQGSYEPQRKSRVLANHLLYVPESKETTPQGTHQPIKLKNKKPAHCSLLGMFDLTGLRGCLWWLFGSCIANCRGGGTKLGASEASEGLEDFVGLRMGWETETRKWGFFLCKRELFHKKKERLIPPFQPSFSSDLFLLFFRGV